jgi:hypothetical protein
MAASQSVKPTLLSDGKRMRLIWRPGDGNGEPSRHFVERSTKTLKGHPTWKLFMEEIKLPILRGSVNEPPHYTYLDDKACYTIWCTLLYTQDELREFWPFDFDNQGNVKTGRKNRGRPAYSNDNEMELAKTPLRGKGKWYEFLGAPEEITEYTPIRPKKKTKAEMEVEEEYARRACMENDNGKSRIGRKLFGNPQTIITTANTPTQNTNDIYLWQTQSSTAPYKNYRSPQHSPPELSLSSGLEPRLLSSFPVIDPVGNRQMPRKRKLSQPFYVGSSGSGLVTPSPKRGNLCPHDAMLSPSRKVLNNFGVDGANDDDGDYQVDMDGTNNDGHAYYSSLAARCTRAQISQPESRSLKFTRNTFTQLEDEVQTLVCS